MSSIKSANKRDIRKTKEFQEAVNQQVDFQLKQLGQDMQFNFRVMEMAMKYPWFVQWRYRRLHKFMKKSIGA